MVIPTKTGCLALACESGSDLLYMEFYIGFKYETSSDLDIVAVYGYAPTAKAFSFEPEQREVLYTEVEEVDWSKVPMDTKVQVRDEYEDEWSNRYFYGVGKNKDCMMYNTFADGATSFSCCRHPETKEPVTTPWDMIRLYEE